MVSPAVPLARLRRPGRTTFSAHLLLELGRGRELSRLPVVDRGREDHGQVLDGLLGWKMLDRLGNPKGRKSDLELASAACRSQQAHEMCSCRHCVCVLPGWK